jgi:hypothetical protein
MLFHVSIDADEPRRVAEVIAEMWGGTATPFPPVIEGSWIAMAGDERNTAVEVYPRGTELVEGEGDADGYGMIGSNGRGSSTHFAMATHLGMKDVLAIARREGWPIKYRKRGGAFGVLELWIEGARMIEVLTPEMQAEYRAAFTVEGWKGFLASAGVEALVAA